MSAGLKGLGLREVETNFGIEGRRFRYETPGRPQFRFSKMTVDLFFKLRSAV